MAVRWLYNYCRVWRVCKILKNNFMMSDLLKMTLRWMWDECKISVRWLCEKPPSQDKRTWYCWKMFVRWMVNILWVYDDKSSWAEYHKILYEGWETESEFLNLCILRLKSPFAAKKVSKASFTFVCRAGGAGSALTDMVSIGGGKRWGGGVGGMYW